MTSFSICAVIVMAGLDASASIRAYAELILVDVLLTLVTAEALLLLSSRMARGPA